MADLEPRDDQLRQLWRSAPPDAPPTQPEEMLMHAIDRSKKLTRTLFWRDLREGLAILLVVGVAARTAWTTPGWLPWLGAVALALCCGLVWRDLRKGRGLEPDPTAPTTRWLDDELERLDTEIDKLRTVGRWYMVPIAVGTTLWMVSLVPFGQLKIGQAALICALVVAVCTGIFALMGKGVVVLNRRAVEVDLLPYRRELEALIVE